MKKDSITYKLLKFADTQAYTDLCWCGRTSACNIVTGLIKVPFVATAILLAVLGVIGLVGMLGWVVGSMLAYLSLPLLNMLGVMDWFSGEYYQMGLFLSVACMVCWTLFGIADCIKGKMKVVPTYLKSKKEQDTPSTPHWITLWVKGLRDKVCYFVKLED